MNHRDFDFKAYYRPFRDCGQLASPGRDLECRRPNWRFLALTSVCQCLLTTIEGADWTHENLKLESSKTEPLSSLANRVTERERQGGRKRREVGREGGWERKKYR